MKRNIRHLLTGLFLTFLASSCESELEGNGGNITGTYSSQTETSITTIHVQATSNGYRISCAFDDTRENNLASFEWKGSFQKVPTDKVLDTDSKEIGTVEFTEGAVSFKTKNQTTRYLQSLCRRHGRHHGPQDCKTETIINQTPKKQQGFEKTVFSYRSFQNLAVLYPDTLRLKD